MHRVILRVVIPNPRARVCAWGDNGGNDGGGNDEHGEAGTLHRRVSSMSWREVRESRRTR